MSVKPGLIGTVWQEFRASYDEEEIRTVVRPSIMHLLGMTTVGLCAVLWFVPAAREFSGFRQPLVSGSLFALGHPLSVALQRSRGTAFGVLNVASIATFATACAALAVTTEPPFSYAVGIASVVTASEWGRYFGPSRLMLLAVAGLPTSISLLAWPDLSVVLLFVLAAVVFQFRVAATRRERAISEQRSELALASLQQANRLASVGRLATSIVHELDQHLFSLRGFTERLQRDHPESLGAGARFVERIAEAAECMRRIVANVRGMGGAARRERRELELSEALRGALALFEPKARDRGIAVAKTGSWSARVLGDEVELQQVFINLLINAEEAISALPSGALREITVEVVPRPDQVWVRFVDTGPGVALEQRDSLFAQGFSTKSEVGGLGVGLWISRLLIRSAGGDLRYQAPESSTGAIFVVEIPRARDTPAASAAAGASEGPRPSCST